LSLIKDAVFIRKRCKANLYILCLSILFADKKKVSDKQEKGDKDMKTVENGKLLVANWNEITPRQMNEISEDYFKDAIVDGDAKIVCIKLREL
jgi:hypothetical protein